MLADKALSEEMKNDFMKFMSTKNLKLSYDLSVTVKITTISSDINQRYLRWEHGQFN